MALAEKERGSGDEAGRAVALHEHTLAAKVLEEAGGSVGGVRIEPDGGAAGAHAGEAGHGNGGCMVGDAGPCNSSAFGKDEQPTD